jgi:hypothetical protein
MRGPDYKGSARFALDGAGRMIEILQEFPEQGMRKPILAGFRKAAIPVKKAMIDSIPSKISAVKKAIKIKSARRALVMNVGVYAKSGFYVNRRGIKWDPYQLAYWFNYGTYANRSPGHQFVRERGRYTKDKPGGIRADLFIERALENSIDSAARELEVTWANEISKLCDKYGATK